MYSRILDADTYGKVILAAPEVKDEGEETAREIVKVLARESETVEKAHDVAYVTPYWEMSVKDLAGEIGEHVTAHQVGRAARELGLQSRRTRDGYVVVWNQVQLDILRRFLMV